MRVIELEQKLEDQQRETETQKQLQKMKEQQITDLRTSHSQLNFQVEGKLEESAENMNQLLLTNKTLTLEKEASHKKMEQFKKLAQKVPALEQQLKEQQELATEREKKRLTLIREKSELEDKEYNLSNRLKKLEARFSTNEKQLHDTIAENEDLQTKLTKAQKGSFLEMANPNSSTHVGDTGESLMSIQMSQDHNTLTQSLALVQVERERDQHKWKSERLVLEAQLGELNASLKQKDEDSIRREYRMRKKHEEELE